MNPLAARFILPQFTTIGNPMSTFHPRIHRLTSLLLAWCFGMALLAAPGAQAQTEAVKAAATAEAAKPAAESHDNPYGLKAMIEHGDAVSKGVLGVLLIMSLGTWIVLGTKWLEQRKLLTEAKAVGAGARFWSAGSLRQARATRACSPAST
jgi:hypothetical protein